VESDQPASRERPGLARALETVGDRWSLQVVAALLGGALRFTDLHQELPAIASNVLAERLRRLEAAGVLVSEPYSDRPPRAEYRLTRGGRELAAVIAALASWGGSEPTLPVHGPCGTSMESRWYCPVCQEVAPGDGGQEAGEDVVWA